jgi:hypothetical protein
VLILLGFFTPKCAGFGLLMAADRESINQAPAAATQSAARAVVEPAMVASATIAPVNGPPSDRSETGRRHALVRRQRIFTAAVGFMCCVVLVLGYLTLRSRAKTRRGR